MENRRVTRGKRVRYDTIYNGLEDSDDGSEMQCVMGDEDDVPDEDLQRRKKIRDTNKEFARRMTILQAWSDYWVGYKTREGEAYSKEEARSIMKKGKKITCPIAGCKRSFTSKGGLRYHYARCGIGERNFKCKVCEPQLELKTQGDLLKHMVRVHYDSLPRLDEEQNEIAHRLLTSARKNDRAHRPLGDAESNSAQPKYYIRSYANLVESAEAQVSIVARPFQEWQATQRDWDVLVNDIDRRRFCPPEASSVRFKTSRQPYWSSLNVGESTVLRSEEDRTGSVAFFTGGVNTAAAWAPRPCRNVPDQSATTVEHLAIAVNACPMDRSIMYKDMKDITGCVQFWSANLSSATKPTAATAASLLTKPKLEFLIGHNFGVITAMGWCPLGASYELPVNGNTNPPDGTMPRLGLLALACGDGIVRIISVPHPEHLMRRSHASQLGAKLPDGGLDATPMFRVKPVASLMPPGVGLSTDHQTIACTSFSWNVDDNQRLIAVGYSNGDVCLFDLANSSPILYSQCDRRHIYHSYRRWQAHLLPVVGVAVLSKDVERTLLASGGRDRVLRMWDSSDMEACLEYERAPITNLVWDYRLRGVITSSEAAFTSFLNRVSYRYPCAEGTVGTTVSIHRTTVCGLNNSLITSAIATSDEAGEVFVQPTGRPNAKRHKNLLDTFSLYTLLPREKRDEAAGAMCPSSQQNQLCAEGGSRGRDSAGLRTPDAAAADQNNEEQDLENQVIDDYTFAERPIANKPAKFLLPIDERAVDTYEDFKTNYGLEFVEYDDRPGRGSSGGSSSGGGQKLPEAWVRASNTSNIYCDRVCDYPFSAIKQVTWSPNVHSYSYLLSVSHVGLCRLDRIKTMETIYGGHIDSMITSPGKIKDETSAHGGRQ